ncbi:hypothetical protein MPH_04374 [Macrophomina phaseolina MS6]|uniref:Uncharacterized protein n=1 Tax=Macrophomina phaseolina (strain MS6) TaxID=1126212 RepID=K2RU97_MACPH|nr:hypothetical protein MPH_04374 [Macrophomina phaseolina MS6]
MERIRGDMVGQGWIQRREESRARVLAELKRLVQEMRDIPAPGPEVRSIDGGSPFDPRLPGPSLRFGPCKNIQDFHKHLRGGLESNPNLDLEVNELIALQKRSWPLPTLPMVTLAVLIFSSGEIRSSELLTGRPPVGFRLIGNRRQPAK